MEDINELPYAEWLEGSLKSIIGKPVQAICLMTKLETGEVGSGYYNASMTDKLVFAGFIQQDAMLDTLVVNGFVEEDTEEDEED